MTRKALLILAVAWAALTACSSDKDVRRDPEGGPEFAMQKRRPRHGAGPAGASDQMKVDNELGVLDDHEVEETLGEHFGEVKACYERAGKAQRYAGGKVLLRFLVEGNGHSRDVLVIESDLGNYEVERCLVEVGRRIVFDAPNGRKATTFDYPVEFLSSNQLAVLDIDGVKIERDLAVFLPQLAACGQLAHQDVVAIMYIEPSGFPGSVGLSAPAELDEDAGDCMVQTIRRWKMSASLPGHALRANFRIPPVIASAGPEPAPRRAISSFSGRKKRR